MHFAPLLALAVFASGAPAMDYSRIDRTLAAEPEYLADMPQYALLLFGPEAELRVWVVVDRDTLYVDRNGDGDLTAPEDRIGAFDAGRTRTIREEIAVGAGGPGGPEPQYVIATVSRFEDKRGDDPRQFLLVHVQTPGQSYRQYAGVELKDSPTAAHLAHFDGPLRIHPGSDDGRPGPEHVLRIGPDSIGFDAFIGTVDPGHGCWTAVEVERGKEPILPAGVFPQVEIEFPARRRGEPPIRRTYPLSGFC